MICAPRHILLGDEIKDEMGGHVTSMVENKKTGNAGISL
jgi:hypothetical protein